LLFIFVYKFRRFCAEMSAAVEKSSENAKETMKRIREQGVRLKYLLMRSAASAGMILGVWLVGYFRYNVTWVLVPSIVYVGVVEYRKWRKSATGAHEDEQSLLGRVEELPSWVSIARRPSYVTGKV